VTMRRSSSITAVMAALAIGAVAAQAGSGHTPGDTPPLESAPAATAGGEAPRAALALYQPRPGCDATVLVVYRGPHGPRPCRGENAGTGFVSPCTPARQSQRALREFGATCFVRAP